MTRKPAAFAEVIHGQSRHPLYGTWYAMMRRCENPQDGGYKDYGGRGIKVCDRWHDVALFIADIALNQQRFLVHFQGLVMIAASIVEIGQVDQGVAQAAPVANFTPKS